MKLSLVICVYNTDPAYLRQALRSIADSTLTDYEICLVDDGSAQDYSALAEEFGARLCKTENGGILHARIVGVGMATGTYTAFFDSDDTTSVDYHRPMLLRAEETGADIVINDWAFRTEKARYFCPRDRTLSQNLWEERDGILRLFASQGGREHSFYVTWNKIYRTELLRRSMREIETGPLGRERVSFGEDALINFYAFREARLLTNVHTGYYFYRIHAAQSVNIVSRERLEAQIRSMGQILALMCSGVGNRSGKEEILVGLRRWQCLMSRTHYAHARAGGYRELYPLICQAYAVEKLQKPMWRDSSVYAGTRLLPENFEEIDRALLALLRAGGSVSVILPNRKGYAADTLRRWEAEKMISPPAPEAAETCVRIPKAEFRFRNRVIHHPVVAGIGMLLVPKGSRLRAFLKRIL